MQTFLTVAKDEDMILFVLNMKCVITTYSIFLCFPLSGDSKISDNPTNNHNVGDNNTIPEKSYSNADSMKLRTTSLKRFCGKKSGIYRWVNNETGKSYVGSAIDLSRRLRQYYTISHLIKSNTVITKALLKYG